MAPPKRHLMCTLAATAAGVAASCGTGSPPAQWGTPPDGTHDAMTGSSGASDGGADVLFGGMGNAGGDAGLSMFGDPDPSGGASQGPLDAGACDPQCPASPTISPATGCRTLCIQHGADAGADAASCTIQIPQDHGYGIDSVAIECTPLDPETYGLDAQGQLLLIGEACEALLSEGPKRIEVVLGCPLDL